MLSLEPKKPSLSRVQMTELVLPQHTNALGSVFGGQVVSWIDIAAAICAQRHSGRLVVTANIDDLHFVAPVHLGWIINLQASLNFTSRTSMEVGVRVDAENPRTGETFHTATAYLTFVGLDDMRKPAPIPPIAPETDDEKRRYKEGGLRRQFRLERRSRLKED